MLVNTKRRDRSTDEDKGRACELVRIIVDAEGLTNECGVVLRCTDEKGGFASFTEGQPKIYC